MSLTYSGITRNALLKIGVLDEYQSVSAVQVEDGIRLLNEMLIEWDEAGGIDLGFYPQTASSDTVAIPRWAERAVTLDLGVLFAADYHCDLTPAYLATQESSHSRMVAQAMGDSEADLGYAPRGQSKIGRNDGSL